MTLVCPGRPLPSSCSGICLPLCHWISSWVLPFTACDFKFMPSPMCSRLGATDGRLPVVAQRMKDVSPSPFRFDFSVVSCCFVMSWHRNWSASSGKGWRRDSWNTNGNGKWTHSGDSQPSWGKKRSWQVVEQFMGTW